MLMLRSIKSIRYLIILYTYVRFIKRKTGYLLFDVLYINTTRKVRIVYTGEEYSFTIPRRMYLS